MKKFEQPMISVKVFNRESILTASGAGQKTASEKASAKLVELGVAEKDIIKVNW